MAPTRSSTLRRLACAAAVATATALSAAPVAAAPPVTIALVDGGAPVSTVNPTYVSWNIDSSCNRGFHHTNFSNPNLAAAAGGLRPSRLRFGGSGNDALVYGLSPGSPECAGVPPPTPGGCGFGTPGCLNASHWDALFGMSAAAGADFIFGVSFDVATAQRVGSRYVWNATNAASLLAYLAAHGQVVWGFELGNEDNMAGGLVAAQQSNALVALAGMLASTPALAGAALVGPDAAGTANWLNWTRAYVSALPAGLLHGVTNHVYNGATRDNFNSPAQLDSVIPDMLAYVGAVRALAPAAEVWSGEIGPHGGGNDGTCLAGAICGTYASAVWYADDLALRAAHGFVQYQRQDLFGGAYGLTNSPSGAMALGPDDAVVLRPDYWTAFLWKRTLGLGVLNATSSSAGVRAYAFAGTPPSPFAAAPCVGAPLQLLLINLSNGTAAAVALPAAPGGGAAASYSAWSLTAAAGEGAFTTLTEINGVATPVQVDVAAVDPATILSGITQPAVVGAVADGATLPPLSSTFVCYHA